MDHQFAADRIHAVVKTLGELTIQSTYENMNKLLGCMQMLDGICNELRKVKADAGNDNAE